MHAGFLRMGALATKTKDEGGRMKDETAARSSSGSDASAFILHPSSLVKPFDRNRRGFLLAEGAAVFVLESPERAARRGARAHALLAGGAEACDAYDIAAPHPEGTGLKVAARLALERAGCRPPDLAALWLHGTATRAGDEAELKAVSRALAGSGRAVPATATKGLTGHLLGASGAAELAFAALCLEAGRLPAVANLESLMPGADALRLVRGAPQALASGCLLVLSAGFGGHSAAAVLRRLS
jgi:3-oxoacyl-[acyl-carrier-protein] synthase II